MDLFGTESKDQQEINLGFIRRDSLTFKRKQETASSNDQQQNEASVTQSSPHEMNLKLLQFDRQSTISKQSVKTAQFGNHKNTENQDNLSQDLSDEEENKAATD